ncbi:Chl4p [Sugiyamaella lignohabitans]|uniref:Chl4p n=1 Tax=Sugiyamaella lignohabitans TaxID=796027 RepID=A0A161HHB4_9ASCO|nr:Chl4p [Sugiyamaella lignohabitans]ANB15370.1 Chl4p [Sugiyamaella lignohabitans]
MYVTQYRPLSLVVVRIQLFEPKTQDLDMNSMAALRSMYLAFPNSSPFVLHSAISSNGPGGGGSGNSTINSILFSLTSTLSAIGRPISIKPSTDLPTRALHTISVLKGTSSRGSTSLGAWSIFADGIDVSPLNPFVGNRASRKVKKLEFPTTNDAKTKEMRSKMARILFTGSDAKSEEKYRSRGPLPMVEIKLNRPYDQEESELDSFQPKITLRLEGDDVFAGIFQLAVDGAIDVTNIPGWMTGEEGSTTVYIGRTVTI